ncbi:MAG: hypothetical protein ACE3JQ_12310 [Paenisporosarcina sp.]
MGNINVIELIASFSAWYLIGYLAYLLYKKHTARPEVWKVLLFILIGVFSFSISWPMFGSVVKLPLLPLGVWILYAIYRKKEEQWQMYRGYAWLGFIANFIWIVTSLIAIPVNHLIYSENEPESYISNIEHASIILIHPSGYKSSLSKENFMLQIDHLKEKSVHSNEWYNETDMNNDDKKTIERFPYQLIGFTPKWGSGLNSIVYIEEDGKGLLISNSTKQLYFRSEHSLLEGGN